MAEGPVRTVTLKSFRGMDSLSGEVRVVGGSRRRRGVRRTAPQASCQPAQAGNSQAVLAGADVACGAAAGGSAPPSAAHAANCGTHAAPAKPNAEQVRRASGIRFTFVDEPCAGEPAAGNVPAAAKKVGKGAHDKGIEESKQASGQNASKAPSKSGGGGNGGGPIESLWDERSGLNGGAILPDDGIDFVEKVNEHIDLVRLTELMLRGLDEKSSKSLLGQLLDLRYGKNARLSAAREGVPNEKLTWNLPR